MVAPERPAGFRNLDLCRSKDGKFLLQETRRTGVKEFRLAGTRKPNTDDILWKLPVLEMSIRPTKTGTKE